MNLPLPIISLWNNTLVDSENGVPKVGGFDPFNLGRIATLNIFLYFGGFDSATTTSALPYILVDPHTLSDGLVNSPNVLGATVQRLGYPANRLCWEWERFWWRGESRNCSLRA